MKIKTIKYLLFTLVMTCTLTACSQKQESLISVGSTALQPLVEEASVHYATKIMSGLMYKVEDLGQG